MGNFIPLSTKGGKMRTLLSMVMMIALFCSAAAAGEGMLIFKTTPKDVKVYIDGDFKGKADEVLTLNVSEGNHTVKIVKGSESSE
jgi:hypothetical protein